MSNMYQDIEDDMPRPGKSKVMQLECFFVNDSTAALIEQICFKYFNFHCNSLQVFKWYFVSWIDIPHSQPPGEILLS